MTFAQERVGDFPVNPGGGSRARLTRRIDPTNGAGSFAEHHFCEGSTK